MGRDTLRLPRPASVFGHCSRGATSAHTGNGMGSSPSSLSVGYPGYPTLKLLGDEPIPLPVWAEVAPREQWPNTEAGLGNLSVSLPMPQVWEWGTGPGYDPKAEADFR